MAFFSKKEDGNDWFVDIYEKYEYHVFWTAYMIVKNKGEEAFYGCTGYDSEKRSGCRNIRPL